MKTAIIYSHSAKKTTEVAKLIKGNFPQKEVDVFDVNNINLDELKTYKLLILGAPTWYDGELPDYWDILVPALEELNLAKTNVAIFGNGDQVGYPENFGDAVGLLADVFESAGATIVGQTSIKGYTFISSKALKEGEFAGLILDFENQKNKTASRVKEWVKALTQ